MMMKLRNIMGKREAIYQLAREVEMDEAFFPIRTPEEARGEAVKRDAGSQQQAKVLVVVESKAVDDILMEYMSRKSAEAIDNVARLAKKARSQSVGKVVHYMKMFVLDDLSAPAMDKIVEEHVGKDSVVVTDGSSSHVNFKDFFKKHVPYTE